MVFVEIMDIKKENKMKNKEIDRAFQSGMIIKMTLGSLLAAINVDKDTGITTVSVPDTSPLNAEQLVDRSIELLKMLKENKKEK